MIKKKGTLPSCYGSDFINLKKLSLERNQLSGELPDLSGFSTSLKWLWLYANRFNGNLDNKGFGQFESIETLEIRSNSFTGKLKIISPSLFFFSYSFIVLKTGTFPRDVCEMSSLKNLVFWGNSFTGTVHVKV